MGIWLVREHGADGSERVEACRDERTALSSLRGMIARGTAGGWHKFHHTAVRQLRAAVEAATDAHEVTPEHLLRIAVAWCSATLIRDAVRVQCVSLEKTEFMPRLDWPAGSDAAAPSGPEADHG